MDTKDLIRGQQRLENLLADITAQLSELKEMHAQLAASIADTKASIADAEAKAARSKPMTTKEAAAYLGHHPYTINRLVRQGLLTAHRGGKKNYYFLADELDAYRLRGTIPAKEEAMPVDDGPMPSKPKRRRVKIKREPVYTTEQARRIAGAAYDRAIAKLAI